MRFNKPVRFPWRVLSRIIKEARNKHLTSKVKREHETASIVVTDPFLQVKLTVESGANFILRGRLSLEPFQGLREPVFIYLARGSTLVVDGDFTMGPGCRIHIDPGARLYIGGRRKESLSGMTERTRVMVHKQVHIGADLVCSWGVFITDCDWHKIKGQRSSEDTLIGNHVWITPNCSILKGSRIGDGCIVASGAVTHRATFPNRSLVGGVPARVLAANREWSRDLPAHKREGNSSNLIEERI
jgi:acetyltransferase-like isoleucine patch superfamily enzyme